MKEVHKLAYYVVNNVSTTQVIDARSPERYNVEADEPREGIRRGHIPGAKNLYYKLLINEKDGTLKSNKEIAKIFL